jgi:Tol biopolymer transport system component
VSSVEGGPVRRIASVGLNVRPFWSTNGKWVYFGSRRTGEWQLWRHTADAADSAGHDGASDESMQVTSHGGFEGIESPDGKSLFYKKDFSDEDLWMMPIDEHGPVERKSTRVIHGGIFSGWWAVAGDGIYYADITRSFKGQFPSTEPKPIYYFDLRTKSRKQLAAIDHRVLFYLPDFAVSRDGRSLTYSQIEFHGIDLDFVRAFQ